MTSGIVWQCADNALPNSAALSNRFISKFTDLVSDCGMSEYDLDLFVNCSTVETTAHLQTNVDTWD
eukprot:m.10493 g.10493  ORF g.10493 m.10493 type:complete len:66 (+) comp7521_c0_seq1:1638-1835(+)